VRAPTPAIAAARTALANRLREIRVDVGLIASDLAAHAGWQRSKISKIEHARQTPTVADIRPWCEQLGATAQVPDLLASLHAVEGMWVEWRRLGSHARLPGTLRHKSRANSVTYGQPRRDRREHRDAERRDRHGLHNSVTAWSWSTPTGP
jgi:transcriptional regulator with XRE-family HTH domain